MKDYAPRRATLIALLCEGEGSAVDERSIEQVIANGRKRWSA